MANKNQEINYQAFIPIGITFLGAGVTFMISVNSGIGAGLMGVGSVYLIIGLRRSRE